MKKADSQTSVDHKIIWESKPILRYIYRKWYKNILKQLKNCPKGLSLELGSGCGSIKESIPGTITSDIQFNSWLDITLDGQYVPFKNNSVSSISMIDVFHHLPNPQLLLSETYRVLKPCGKLVFIEPYPTFISSFIYKHFHNEPMNKNQKILLNIKILHLRLQTLVFLWHKA